jgi:ATP-binding cassette subfamily B protein
MMREVAHSRAVDRSWRDLFPMVRAGVRTVRGAARRPWTTGIVLQVVQAALAAAQVFGAERLLAALVRADDGGSTALGPVVVPAAILVGASLVSGLLQVWDQLLSRLVSALVERSTWERVLSVSTSVDLATFESPAFFDRMRRIEANTLLRPYALTTGLTNLVGGIAGTAAVGASVIRLEPLLLPLLVAGGVPLLLLSRRTGRLEFAFALRSTAGQRRRRYFREVLIGRSEAKELRSFDATDALRREYGQSYDQWIQELHAHLRDRLRLGLLGSAATASVTILSLGGVLALASGGGTGLAEAGAALVALRILGQKVQQVAGALGALFESSLFLADLDAFEALRPQRPSSLPDAGAVEPFTGVRLEGVGFRYPGAGTDALADIDLWVGAGEVVALVGENGSGKTTLSKIVAQLYEPSAGATRWNGSEVPWDGAARRRRQVSAVFQDFVRFGLSARRNIGLGDGDLDPPRERVEDAARRAGADGFVANLPEGFDTILGKEFDRGVDLSVGQWQRIALARAFYRDAPLVVLDEPTASLDARAEHELFEKVRDLLHGRAVLLVTHRLASVREADRIYVLDGGRIVEHGTHDELLLAGGRYAELYELQRSAFA